MNKKALVSVSFGTAATQAIHATQLTEEALRTAYPDFDFYKTYTSKMVIAKLQRTTGVTIPTPLELMENLHRQGYEQVLCQSLHIVKGEEYCKLLEQLQGCTPLFSTLMLGAPLLDAPEDFAAAANAVLQSTPLAEKEALVLMGHGGRHAGNKAYQVLQQMFENLGHNHVLVGAVEGEPSFEAILAKCKAKDIHNVCLRPFLLVAGEHAHSDMAGEGASSWRSLLEADGMQTRCVLSGLGTIPKVAEIFVQHIQNAKRL